MPTSVTSDDGDTMKIRYLLVNAYGAGGTVRSVVQQANALADRHDVELVSAFRHRETPVHALDARVRLVPLLDIRRVSWRSGPIATMPRRWPGRLFPPDSLGLAAVRAAGPTADAVAGRDGRPVADYLRSLGGGIVVGTRPVLNLLSARFAPMDVVRVAHEATFLDAHKPGLAAQIRRWYPGLDAVVVPTEVDEAAYRRALAGGRARVVRIPHGLPPGRRRRSSLDSKVVAASGRLVKGAGFDLLVEAFERVAGVHPDWRLRIYGTGGQRAALARRVRRRGLDRFVTLAERAAGPGDELADASVYALSSRFDGVGTGVLEAMAHGLPVVAFDCPYAPREIIEHRRNGMLVPPGDVAALAAGLDRLIGDAALRKAMGAHAYDTAARYEPARIRSRWEGLFADLATLARMRPVLL